MRPGIRQCQSGISAIELMIGMLLGLILIGGAIAIFLASKRSYTEVEQVSALTENAQFAQRLLSNALLHAGFFGGGSSNPIEMLGHLALADDCSGEASAYYAIPNPPPGYPEKYLDPNLFAAVADASGDALGCIDDAEPGSHVLVIKSVIPTPFTGTLSETQTYVMANETDVKMFDGADTPPNDVPRGVTRVYQYQVFYVRKRDGLPPMLSRKTLIFKDGGMTLGDPEELVEGVEDMRLRFGLVGAGSQNGKVDTYAALSGMAGNWGDVVSVEISVLVRSATEDPNYTNPKSYSMPGGDIEKADHYRRVLITTSMSLRNPKLLIRGNAA